jgi:hypothetical protein
MSISYSKIKGFGPIYFLIGISFVLLSTLPAESQVVMTNNDAEQVLLGKYNPALYTPSKVINHKDSIIQQLVSGVSQDSLKTYLIELEKFGTRNSGSDTLSNKRGIGATRRWIRKKFMEFSAANENRLLVSYLSFNSNMCGQSKHRNVLAVLPGLDTARKDVLIVEAHMDSRCGSSCDTACYAPGMDDNGSGTVLVMELARTMSRFAFDRTIIFTTVTGEEQGLRGGEAMAQYLKDKDNSLLACLNHDVVGGIECGINSSPPSCSPAGSLDSINLRVFSFSPANDTDFVSIHKQLARYVKLQQIEEINPATGFNTNLQLQIREDRVGRGGDHIPFRQRLMTAIRFTSSHEHGNGAGNAPDRQHTSADVLGYDLTVPPDGVLDTFLVNFAYLRRNTLTNGINLALLANSPPIPEPVYELFEFGNISAIRFTGIDTLYAHRIGVRKRHSSDLYFDTVLTFDKQYIDVSEIEPKGNVQLHCMNLDQDIESVPTTHISNAYLGIPDNEEDVNCLEVYPNPASTSLNFKWKCSLEPKFIEIEMYSLSGQLSGKWEFSNLQELQSFEMNLNKLLKGPYQLISIVNNDELFTELLIIQ